MASNRDLKPAKGCIFHLIAFKDVNPDHFKHSGLEPDAMNHPALVLESNEQKRIAVIFVITSHKGKSLIVRYPETPARRANSHKKRRLEYLPINPSPPHPDNGKLLTVENPSRCVMSYGSCVKIAKAYAVNWQLLKPYRARENSTVKLDSKSWEVLCSQVKPNDLELIKQWKPTLRPVIDQCRSPPSITPRIIDISSSSTPPIRGTPPPYSYRSTPTPPSQIPRAYTRYLSNSDTESQPLVRSHSSSSRQNWLWRPTQRTSIRESNFFRFVANFTTGTWGLLCRYRICIAIIGLIFIWQFGLIGKGAQLLWLGIKRAAYWFGSTTWTFTKWCGTSIWEAMKACGRWIGEGVAGLWGSSGTGGAANGMVENIRNLGRVIRP